MSKPKLKALRPKMLTLTGHYVPWRLGAARGDESVRWECVDGRWVAISLGHGDETGSAIVTSSEGRRDKCDSYEVALELARRWRTMAPDPII